MFISPAKAASKSTSRSSWTPQKLRNLRTSKKPPWTGSKPSASQLQPQCNVRNEFLLVAAEIYKEINQRFQQWKPALTPVS